MIILHDGRVGATSSEHIEDYSIKLYNIKTNKIDIDIKEANEETFPNINIIYSLLAEHKYGKLKIIHINYYKK